MRVKHGSPPDPLVLRGVLDLDGSRVGRLRRHGARGGAIGLDVPGVPPADGMRAALRLTSAARDCGCDTGSQVATVVLLVTAVLHRIAAGSWLPLSRSDTATLVLSVIVAALVGKGLGIALARRRMYAELSTLRLSAGGA